MTASGLKLTQTENHVDKPVRSTHTVIYPRYGFMYLYKKINLLQVQNVDLFLCGQKLDPLDFCVFQCVADLCFDHFVVHRCFLMMLTCPL